MRRVTLVALLLAGLVAFAAAQASAPSQPASIAQHDAAGVQPDANEAGEREASTKQHAAAINPPPATRESVPSLLS